ncbi:MAG: phospho-N-acetylmuramoyl-pentapeptide-transferase [Patescibacteria group bacterium]
MPSIEYFEIIRILFLFAISFVVAICLTPLLTHFLYKYKLGKNIRSNGKTPIYTKLHEKKAGTPTMGGIIIWLTTLILAILFYYLAKLVPTLKELNFLDRAETLLPLGALIASAIIGLFDDWLDICNKKGGGFKMRYRALIFTAIAIIGALWFYYKLDWDVIHIPFWTNLEIGWWYIPIFIGIIFATSFSVNETDGLDGLAGGSLLSGFAAYGVISFLLGRYELAAFCGVISGALLAFLWFNIYPARFFMGDTGSMSLGVTLGIIAMLTNYMLLLPIIGFIFVVESMSVIIQISSRAILKKKVFRSAPIHHHFEAMGWPEPKIVMRFWIVSAVMASLGIVLFLLDKGF